MLDRKCQGCGKPLTPSSGTKPRKWCSNACRVASYYSDPNYRKRQAVAAAARHRKRISARGPLVHDLVCRQCGVNFVAGYRRKYCSAKCRSHAYNVARMADGRAADYSAKRRALERGAKISRGRRIAVLERDGWICQLCNLPTNRDAIYPAWDFAVVDHVVPLARGGEHGPANWSTAHAFCNALKRDLLLSEFRLAYPDIAERVLALAA